MRALPLLLVVALLSTAAATATGHTDDAARDEFQFLSTAPTDCHDTSIDMVGADASSDGLRVIVAISFLDLDGGLVCNGISFPRELTSASFHLFYGVSTPAFPSYTFELAADPRSVTGCGRLDAPSGPDPEGCFGVIERADDAVVWTFPIVGTYASSSEVTEYDLYGTWLTNGLPQSDSYVSTHGRNAGPLARDTGVLPAIRIS